MPKVEAHLLVPVKHNQILTHETWLVKSHFPCSQCYNTVVQFPVILP